MNALYKGASLLVFGFGSWTDALYLMGAQALVGTSLSSRGYHSARADDLESGCRPRSVAAQLSVDASEKVYQQGFVDKELLDLHIQ